jgi:signal transduction histidine kinase
MSTQAQLPPVTQTLERAAGVVARSRSARYIAGVVVVATAYYASAKLGQTLRYTASVSAIWPPAGFGIAALYLWGLRWWPGIFLAELVLNVELLGGPHSLPLGSLVGQQAGNMAEIVAGAVLLERLIGRRAALDRIEQVGGMVVAVAVATAISATVGTLSMVAGAVIEMPDAATFWRTWWLADLSGGLVTLPLMLTWARNPARAWARLRTWEGALLIATVSALGVMAVSMHEPVTYVVFPALIWAAFRFGPPGATLAIAIAAGLAIAITAHEAGPFFVQAIDHRTLSTQLYIAVTALTTLFVSAVVSERERSAAALAEAHEREGERATEERHRIARDLHDSVSQALFSTLLHTRTAQKALSPREDAPPSRSVEQSLGAIAELTRGAQSEMRALIYELSRDPVEHGLVEALGRHAARVGSDVLTLDVQVPDGRVTLSPPTEAQLFGIAREALTNVVKHAGASAAWIRVEAPPGAVVLEIRDDGRGFNPAAGHPGHFGLESMRSRADEIGGRLTITSAAGRGTVVRVEAPAQAGANANGA